MSNKELKCAYHIKTFMKAMAECGNIRSNEIDKLSREEKDSLSAMCTMICEGADVDRSSYSKNVNDTFNTYLKLV